MEKMKNPKELLVDYSRRMSDPHERYYMCKEIDVPYCLFALYRGRPYF